MVHRGELKAEAPASPLDAAQPPAAEPAAESGADACAADALEPESEVARQATLNLAELSTSSIPGSHASSSLDAFGKAERLLGATAAEPSQLTVDEEDEDDDAEEDAADRQKKADGLLSMLEDASKSDETRKFKRKKRKKLVKSTNNTVGTAVSELGMVAKMSKEQPAETFEPEQLDSKQFRKQFEASTASKVVVTVEPIPPIKAIVEGGFQVNLHRLSGLGGDRFGRGVGQVYPVLLNGEIPLNKALLRVGFHFGLSTGDRMFGGRVGKKVAWERPKWRLSYLLPFYDPRIPAYDTKKVPLDSDDDWHFALADKPWSQETMRSKTLEYMSLKIEADDADLQEEGTHAMWEFAANKAHHETFTHEMIKLLMRALGSESIRAKLYACATVWHLTKTESARMLLIDAGVVERLLAVLLYLPYLERLATRTNPTEPALVLLRAGSHEDRIRIQAASAGALCNLLRLEANARLRFYKPLSVVNASRSAGSQLALVTPTTVWNALSALAYLPARDETAFEALRAQVHAAKDAPLTWDDVAPVVPEMAAGVLPMLLEEERARETYAAANGIQNLAALLSSHSLWVGRAAAASLRLFVLDEQLRHVRALPSSAHDDVLERVLAWTLRWARVVDPSPEQAARTTDRERLRLQELARYAGLMQDMAEDLTLVLWALVTADADLPEPRMSEAVVAGLVELGLTVVNHKHLARMALPMSAMLLIMCNQEHYAHMLMTHGMLRLLLNLLRVPVVPVQERVLAALGMIASYSDPSVVRLWGTPPQRVPTCFTGYYRQTLADAGVLKLALATQRRWPDNPRVAEMTAGLLMWLSTTTKNVKKADLEGVMALLETRNSNTVMYTAAALWCLVFPEENRELAVRCGALHRLVDAGEVQLEAMRTRPSTAVVSANHFIIASLALLLTHKSQTTNKRLVMGALLLSKGSKMPTYAETRMRACRLLLSVVNVPRFHDGPARAAGSAATRCSSSAADSRPLRGSSAGVVTMSPMSSAPPSPSRSHRPPLSRASTAQGGTRNWRATFPEPYKSPKKKTPEEIQQEIDATLQMDGPPPIVYRRKAPPGLERDVNVTSLIDRSTRRAQPGGQHGEMVRARRTSVVEQPKKLQREGDVEAAAEAAAAAAAAAGTPKHSIAAAPLSQATQWKGKLSSPQLAILERSMQRLRDFAITTLYSVAIRTPGAYDEICSIGTAVAFIKLAQDEATVVETRALAATALQGMVTRDDVNNIERNIVQLMMSEGVLEDIFCAFMRSRDPLLEERGAKGAAHLAIVKSRQVLLRKGGAIDALAGIVRRAFVEHGESTTTEPTLIIALVGLLNLSLHLDNQVPIAHKSLAMLLRFNKEGPWSSDVVLLTSGILNNISKHPGNRTLLYRAELHEKGQAAASAQAMGDDLPLEGAKYMHLLERPVSVQTSVSFSATGLSRAQARDAESIGRPSSLQRLTTPLSRPGTQATLGGRAGRASVELGMGRPSSVPSFPGRSDTPKTSLRPETSQTLRRPSGTSQSTGRPSTSQQAVSGLGLGPVSWADVGWDGGGDVVASTVGDDVDGIVQWERQALMEGFRVFRERTPIPNLRHLMKAPRSAMWQSITMDSHNFTLTEQHPEGGRLHRWTPKVRGVDRKVESKMKLGVADLVRVLNPAQLLAAARKAAKETAEEAAKEEAAVKRTAEGHGGDHARSPLARVSRDSSSSLREVNSRRSFIAHRRSSLINVEAEQERAPAEPEKKQDITNLLRPFQRFRLAVVFLCKHDNRQRYKRIELEDLESKVKRRKTTNLDKEGLTIKMGKPRARNNITFKSGFESKEQVEKLDMFRHVPGAKACMGLFKHVHTEDGTCIHCFEHTKQMVDELKLPWDSPPPVPTTLAEALLTELPPTDFNRNLSRLNAAKLDKPPPYRSFLVNAAWPEKHTLNVQQHECVDPLTCKYHGLMVPITPALELEVAVNTTLEKARVEELNVWTLKQSLFIRRLRQCDANDYYDSDKFMGKMMERDLRQMLFRRRFTRLLPENILEASKKLTKTFNKYYRVLVGIFYFYCAQDGNPECHHMQGSEWMKFLTDAQIPNDKSAQCKRHDLERVFMETSYLDESERDMGKVQVKDAILRYEFMEAVVRVALAKYDVKRTAARAVPGELDVFGCICKLMDVDVLPNLPAEALVDRNQFRRKRLYKENVDGLLRRHVASLQAVYEFYKTYGVETIVGQSKNDTLYQMSLTEFMNFMRDAKLIDVGEYDGFTSKEAKYVFIWSRMFVIDEFRMSLKVANMSFMDFLEALGRIADIASYPTPAELVQWQEGLQIGQRKRADLKEDEIPTLREYIHKVNMGLKQHPRRASAGLFKEPTRGLEEKLHQLMTHMFEGLCVTHQVASTQALLRKLKFLTANAQIMAPTKPK